jgi:hypothetical protein
LVASFAPEFQANRSKIVGRYWSFHWLFHFYPLDE